MSEPSQIPDILKTVNPQLLATLAKSPDPQVRLDVSKNPFTSTKTLRALLADPSSEVRAASAETFGSIELGKEDLDFVATKAFPELLDRLSTCKNLTTREHVASNPNLTEKTAIQMARSATDDRNQYLVLMELVRNPNSPRQALKIIQGGDLYKAIPIKHRNFQITAPERLLTALLKMNKAELKFLIWEVRDKFPKANWIETAIDVITDVDGIADNGRMPIRKVINLANTRKKMEGLFPKLSKAKAEEKDFPTATKILSEPDVSMISGAIFAGMTGRIDPKLFEDLDVASKWLTAALNLDGHSRLTSTAIDTQEDFAAKFQQRRKAEEAFKIIQANCPPAVFKEAKVHALRNAIAHWPDEWGTPSKDSETKSPYDGMTKKELAEVDKGFRAANDPHESYPEWD